jgi:SagB-type dehydrogenase family enzyme
MTKKLVIVLGIIIFVCLATAGFALFFPFLRFPQKDQAITVPTPTNQFFQEDIIGLPPAKVSGSVSLEETILKRRSQREYTKESLSLDQISQILWAGQGITEEKMGFRSVPSAGALYPLDIYVAVGEGRVEGLMTGVYQFLPKEHNIKFLQKGDVREPLMKASLGQTFIAQAPVVLIITGEYERTTVKYGERGKQYVHMEAGHAAQNIYLQVESLGLGTVTVGAFIEEEISKILNLPKTHRPLYIMPVGHIK